METIVSDAGLTLPKRMLRGMRRVHIQHIHADQQDALSFLQISHPWLNAEDILQNVDETRSEERRVGKEC